MEITLQVSEYKKVKIPEADQKNITIDMMIKLLNENSKFQYNSDQFINNGYICQYDSQYHGSPVLKKIKIANQFETRIFQIIEDVRNYTTNKSHQHDNQMNIGMIVDKSNAIKREHPEHFPPTLKEI